MRPLWSFAKLFLRGLRAVLTAPTEGNDFVAAAIKEAVIDASPRERWKPVAVALSLNCALLSLLLVAALLVSSSIAMLAFLGAGLILALLLTATWVLRRGSEGETP